MKILKYFPVLALAVAPLFAYDGDMDIYHEFKEDLALVRDSYVSSLNMVMDDASPEGDLKGWLELREKGGARSWAQLEYEAPECNYLTVVEMPYGFKLKGKHGAYKVNVEVRVVTRDTDIFYDVKFLKDTNGPGKEILGEVFRNDRVIFYDESTPCKRQSVTCINEYSKGTLGK